MGGSRGGWLATLLLAAAAPWAGTATAESGLSSVVFQDREVSVDVDLVEDFYSSCIPLLDPGCEPDSTTTTSFSDSDSAADTGPFVATASRPEFPASFASQDSEISDTAIRATGSHAATATFSNPGGFPTTLHSELHDVGSRAVVTFAVDTTVGYSITGSVTTGGAIFSSSSSLVRLSGAGGVIAEVRVDSDPDCSDPACFTVGPEPLAASGSLAPGVYTLEAVASGTAGGVHGPSGSFGTGVEGAFDVELVLGPPVPSLEPFGVALVALALGAAGAWGLRRRDDRFART